MIFKKKKNLPQKFKQLVMVWYESPYAVRYTDGAG